MAAAKGWLLLLQVVALGLALVVAADLLLACWQEEPNFNKPDAHSTELSLQETLSHAWRVEGDPHLGQMSRESVKWVLAPC